MNANVREHVLATIGFARRTDAPLLGCLIGAHQASASEPTLGLSYVLDALAGPTELGVLADLSLGIPVRAHYGLDYRLVTASLDVALSIPCPPLAQLRITPDPTTSASPTGTHLSAGHIVTQSDKNNGASTGICSAVFGARGGGLARLPWETGLRTEPRDRLTDDQLTGPELQVINTLTSSAQAPGTALLNAATSLTRDRPTLQPTPTMANRAGVVQGGVIFGFALTAGLRSASPAAFSAHVDFVGPASTDHPVEAQTTVLRSGTRQQLSRVDLTQHGELVATATLRHAAD
jgi:hypothetical protein